MPSPCLERAKDPELHAIVAGDHCIRKSVQHARYAARLSPLFGRGRAVRLEPFGPRPTVAPRSPQHPRAVTARRTARWSSPSRLAPASASPRPGSRSIEEGGARGPRPDRDRADSRRRGSVLRGATPTEAPRRSSSPTAPRTSRSRSSASAPRARAPWQRHHGGRGDARASPDRAEAAGRPVRDRRLAGGSTSPALHAADGHVGRRSSSDHAAWASTASPSSSPR